MVGFRNFTKAVRWIHFQFVQRMPFLLTLLALLATQLLPASSANPWMPNGQKCATINSSSVRPVEIGQAELSLPVAGKIAFLQFFGSILSVGATLDRTHDRHASTAVVVPILEPHGTGIPYDCMIATLRRRPDPGFSNARDTLFEYPHQGWAHLTEAVRHYVQQKNQAPPKHAIDGAGTQAALPLMSGNSLFAALFLGPLTDVDAPEFRLITAYYRNEASAVDVYGLVMCWSPRQSNAEICEILRVLHSDIFFAARVHLRPSRSEDALRAFELLSKRFAITVR